MRVSLHTFRPFTASEAWLLFRLAAFGEAIGWTLLIIGIGCEQYLPSHSHIPVMIAGRIHGTLFMLYALASLGLAPSLGWRPLRALLATAASVPPYGSLLFERWEARRRTQTPTTAEQIVQIIIRLGDKVLGVQPSQGVEWLLPYTAIQSGETAQQAAQRLINESLGITLTGRDIRPYNANIPTFTATMPSRHSMPDFTPYIKHTSDIDDARFVHASRIAQTTNT